MAGLPARAASMARSLMAAATAAGYGEDEAHALDRAFAVAMGPRAEVLADDHHPAFLHPGRSPLIIIRDVGGVDVSVLVVAALHESTDHQFRASPEQIETELGASALRAVQSIPLPGDERLAERLLSLGPGLPLAALAERLDDLRHLHLREDRVDGWADAYGEVVDVWLPFAQRIHPRLATRYAHWARTFVKRI